MAFAVKIVGLSRLGGQPLFSMEPPWWPARELQQDPRFKRTAGDPGYLDFAAEMSIAEARELHARLRPRSGQGVFADPDWQAIIQPMRQQLDAWLSGPPADCAGVRVEVYEWESGYSE